MARIKPLGVESMMALVRQDRMFRDAMATNLREATCKVCGTLLPRGWGIRWFRFAPNGFHFNHNFLCPACDKFWWDTVWGVSKTRLKGGASCG